MTSKSRLKIGVLSSLAGWHMEDLQRAAQGRHRLVHLDFRKLSGTIDGGDSQINVAAHCLNTFDRIIVRAMPAGSLEQVVARMDLLFQLASQGVTVVNPPKTIEAAVDKYLCLCRLKSANVPIPSSAVFQDAESAFNFFLKHNSDVVYKPLFGSEGRGLKRLTEPDDAANFFSQCVEAEKVIFLQEFMETQLDLRVLVLGEKAFAMSRNNAHDWRKNASLGAVTKPHRATAREIELAFHAAKAVGNQIAGVDLLLDNHGEYQVIEVNSSPGWRMLAQTLQSDIAAEVLAYLEELH